MFRNLSVLSPAARIAASSRAGMAHSMRMVQPARMAHAISNPTLRKLEDRWDSMTEVEREEVISQLKERQLGDWKELTPLEKRAAWYVSYGEWGPRRPVHPAGSGFKIFTGVLLGIAAAGALFVGFRLISPPLPKTMSLEWQEKANELLAEVNAEPFTGYNQIQSPPTGISEADLEDDDDE